jgi:hypothetical protein
MGGGDYKMILFDSKGKDLYLSTLVSAKYVMDSRHVITSQTYNDVAYLRIKIKWPHRLLQVTREDYVFIRNYYYELSTVLFTPDISFLKDASNNQSFYRLTMHSSKDGLSIPLDAILLFSKSIDFTKPHSKALITKQFLKYVRDGLDFLETYYGRLPF